MKYIGHLDGTALEWQRDARCEETRLSIQDRQATDERSTVIGPIYLFAMRASRARRTEPAGQREKTTAPGRSRQRGANNRLESGLVAVQCKPTSGCPEGVL